MPFGGIAGGPHEDSLSIRALVAVHVADEIDEEIPAVLIA
jgi:hypothetical protein